MAVDWTDITNTECFKKCWWLQKFANAGLERFHATLGLCANDGEILQEFFDLALATDIHRIQANVGELVRQRTLAEVGNSRRITATVVIKHHDDAFATMSKIVQCLVRHTTGH